MSTSTNASKILSNGTDIPNSQTPPMELPYVTTANVSPTPTSTPTPLSLLTSTPAPLSPLTSTPTPLSPPTSTPTPTLLSSSSSSLPKTNYPSKLNTNLTSISDERNTKKLSTAIPSISADSNSQPLLKPLNRKTPPMRSQPSLVAHSNTTTSGSSNVVESHTPSSSLSSTAAPIQNNDHLYGIEAKYLAAGVHESGVLLAKRYRIEKMIGQGGMGKVYLASDIHLERQVVIKVAHFESALEDQNVARFKREALKIASISHPNVVGIYDYGIQEEVQYLVMEWVNGDTIKEELKKTGPLTPERIFTLFTQLLLGLSIAHKINMIHRDIKPSNLIWDPVNHRLKILDFGLARGVSGDTLTETGHVHGSIQYMAPEQIKGEDQDQRTDLYAAGILIYQLITGVLPYDGENTVELMFHKLQEQAPNLKDHPAAYWVPPILNQIIKACLSNELDQRPIDAESCLDDLRKAVIEWADHSLDPPQCHLLPYELINWPTYLKIKDDGNTAVSDRNNNHTKSNIFIDHFLLLSMTAILGMVLAFGYQYMTQEDQFLKWQYSLPASVYITMEDKQATSKVWVDGKIFNSIPKELKLTNGKHLIKVFSKNQIWEKAISVKGGETFIFDINIQKKIVEPLKIEASSDDSSKLTNGKSVSDAKVKPSSNTKKVKHSPRKTKNKKTRTSKRSSKNIKATNVRNNKKTKSNDTKSDMVPLLEFD
jgi:serine/threonine protein kinase